MPSKRTLAGLGSLAAVVGFSGIAAAQSPTAGTGLGLPARIGIRFGVSFVIYLILGGACAVLGPEYTTERVREIQDDPGSAFGWGFAFGVLVPIGLVVLAITIIGLIVTIPGLILLAVLQLIGFGVTTVWLGNMVAGTRGESVGAKDAVVGAVVLALPFAIPLIGQLLANLIGWFGLGVVGRNAYESWRD
ncbi:hypothetical protein ACOZ4I_08430 [Haloarcula salina]|uniref:hypothetical protein n=1 Tax=Haloarcula salina TaxID=1429914 RepID=UPI003C6F9D59